MTQLAHRRSTFAEYLSLEEISNVKHEYIDGLILAMAGGTPEHAALAASVSGILFGKLRGGRCRVFDSDLRVRTPATGRATYPDVTIVCGRREHDPDDENTVVNPSVLIEILSPSTEQYDRGEKFEHYKRLESLHEVVFVACDARRIEVWRRTEGDHWVMDAAASGQQARLPSLGCTLDVDEVYAAAREPDL
jgi:Uma2 family endonuclease